MPRALLILMASFGLAAASPPPEVESEIASASLTGEARYRFAAMRLYDAELWSASPGFTWDEPFALTLNYRRKFRGQTLANTSIREIARIFEQPETDFDSLREPLMACFADVESGDRLSGIGRTPDSLAFYLNGEQRCELSDPGIRELFFRIWLDDASRFQRQSRALRGLGDD